MAKLKMPLVSFGASGSLGKEIVFFPWKGLNCVRQWVKPTNPNTAAQQAQRTHMTDAVAEFHGADYSAADITAFARFAGALGQIMTGFNRMVKSFITEAIAGGTWERTAGVETSNVFADMFRVTVSKVAAGNAPTLHWGTRKTYFPDSVAMTDNADGTWFGDCTPLVASTPYYFYVDVGAAGVDYGRTGVYLQRTTA